jgi:hypothetical protein
VRQERQDVRAPLLDAYRRDDRAVLSWLSGAAGGGRMTRSWREVSTREVDAGVERQHERALLKWEAEQERLEMEQEARDAEKDEAA